MRIFSRSPARGSETLPRVPFLGRDALPRVPLIPGACRTSPNRFHARETPSRKYTTRAFTLVELMVVVVLLGILTAMILPEMRGTYEDALLRSTARKLVSAMHLSHSQSITLHQTHRLRIDPSAGRYVIEKAARDENEGSGFVPARNLVGSEGEFDPRIAIEVRKGRDETPDTPPPAALDSQEETSSRIADAVIAFHADGTAEAAEIVLRDREGFGLALRINPITGRVRIVEMERK